MAARAEPISIHSLCNQLLSIQQTIRTAERRAAPPAEMLDVLNSANTTVLGALRVIRQLRTHHVNEVTNETQARNRRELKVLKKRSLVIRAKFANTNRTSYQDTMHTTLHCAALD